MQSDLSLFSYISNWSLISTTWWKKHTKKWWLKRQLCRHDKNQKHTPAQCLTRRIPLLVQLCWLCDEAEFPSLALISLHSSSVLDGNEHTCEQAVADNQTYVTYVWLWWDVMANFLGIQYWMDCFYLGTLFTSTTTQTINNSSHLHSLIMGAISWRTNLLYS